MKNNNKKRIACALLVLMSHSAWPYEQDTHRDFSRRAWQGTALASDKTLVQGLGLEKFLSAEKLPAPNGDTGTLRDLIELGADLEDEGTRPKNHFFDPHHDRPATLPPWLTVGVPVGEMSVDWMANGTGQPPGEVFSVPGARASYVEGLTGVSADSRNAAWGRMFQTLGHVVHHLQDMAQPQHVRNDIHYINDFLATHFDGQFKLDWEDRSWFEQYSLENPTIWAAYAPAAATPVSFDRTRDFWVTIDDRGIAQFTNRNFVSSDTNFTYGSQGNIGPADDYPSPQPVGRRTRSVRDPALGISDAEGLCARLAAHPIAGGQPCEIDFVETAVIDGYNGGATVPNDRAASFSVFDAELRAVERSSLGLRLFTLNSVNFKAAYRFLIPKAINYSAGMINHFFRGRLELKDAEARDGYVTILLANASAPGNDFSDGRFSLYYDNDAGARVPLDVQAGALAVGATQKLRFAIPFDLNLRAESPFAVVFEGRIGAEAGVTGLVFDVPDVVEGFLFGATILNGPQPPQLIYRSNGQWRLHPQGELPAAGWVDWKGWYVDGKPTRMLTWDGWRYAKLSSVISNRSPNIYAGGKPFAVAPWPVLGAALQKDADGRAWIVAICEDKALDQDIVVRRPARKSASSVLFDATSSPDGWRVIGRFRRPDHLHSDRETWQFNGAGTEAQTMRTMKGYAGTYGAPQTRLKVTLAGETALFEELGNTRVQRTRVEDVTASRTEDGRTYDYCYGVGTIDATITTTMTGGVVVAVDYVDDREVLARIAAQSAETRVEHGSTGFRGVRVDMDWSRADRWTLEVGANRHELITQDLTYRLRVNFAEPYQLDASHSVLERAAIAALDLRSGLVVLRRHHEERSAETADPTNPDSLSTVSESVYRELAVANVAGAVTPRVDVSTVATSQYVDEYPGTLTYRCSWHNSVLTGRTTSQDWLDASVLAGHLGYGVSADVIGSGTDRSGNVFVSLRHTDAVTKQYRYLNYLTGGDPVALLGVDAQAPFFAAIRPR